MRGVGAGFIAGALLLQAGCSSAPSSLSPVLVTRAEPASSSGACEGHASETLHQLLDCIQRDRLWRRLAVFQQIADANPGPEGHGNRDTGSPGYEASVDYVARLMRRAGYRVTVQPYLYKASRVDGVPAFDVRDRRLTYRRDWYVARGSAPGTVSAPLDPPEGDGCSSNAFNGFPRGSIALLERSTCAFDVQIANARAAGAAAAILYNDEGGAYEARLAAPATIPVVGVVSNQIGSELLRRFASGGEPHARIAIRTHTTHGVDYNLIADSPFGDPNAVVVVDAHLDAIYGAGMLDNASGSTTIIEVALNLAKTPAHNRLRYIWFGGEELGLLGSHYYTQHLSQSELRRIAFDVDADVTATPNFDVLIADARRASNVMHFPPNVVPQSKLGNDYFADYFKNSGIVFRAATFGNDGTDSNAFSLAGVPNSGILTQQDCCKHPWEKRLWGGFLGNYEGDIPSFDGGCVDKPHRWCDNLSNNDPFVLEFASKAVAYVTFQLANHAFPSH